MPAERIGVPAAVEVDHFLRPQGAHQVNLLLGADAPVAEILAQGFELHVVPAHADAQGEASAAEHVDLRGLLGHQRGLALGQDQDAGDQADARGQRSDERQRCQRLVDHAVVRIVTAPDVLVVVRVGAEDVVGDEEVVELHAFHGFDIVADGGRVGADFGLREDCADLHGNLNG